MNLCYVEFQNEIETLVNFLTSDTWEFYGTPNPKPEVIRDQYQNNVYTGENCKTFWVLDQETIVGMVRLYDLQEGDPLFDIRILSKYKGKGIGTNTVKWLVHYLFTQYPEKNRIEANTRQDNYAMRCVFHKCGFVKEAHRRKAWVGQDGQPYDAMGYGITRDDWQRGTMTPVEWTDFPY